MNFLRTALNSQRKTRGQEELNAADFLKLVRSIAKNLEISDEVMKRPPRMMGGQGLISTAGDYARFCEMLVNKGELNGKRVLKSGTVDLMLENHLKDIGKVYGLGGLVNGKGRYEWGGAAGTKFWVDCSKGHYVVFMIQNWGPKPGTWNVFKKHAEAALAGK